MFVKEFSNTSAAELNKQLEKVYNWKLNLNSLKEGAVNTMLETVQNQINNIRKSSQVHHAEHNPKYMEAVMVSKVLETWKNEMAAGRKIIAEKMAAIDAYCTTQLNERELTPTELKKREHYAKSLKKRSGDFEKRYGKRGKEVMYATATKMAKNESFELPPALTEGEIEQARVTMAARDLADTVQDIVEKISTMQNEQLPALVSAMKDEIGMDQANSFNDSTKQVLQGLLDSANTARDTLDDAARGVYGAQPMGAPEMGEPMMTGQDSGAAPMPSADSGAAPMPPRDSGDLDTADSAAGGTAELGRGKRV
jgi:hypothetical protein